MSFRFCECLLFSCFAINLLVGRVMMSPEPEVRQKRSDDGGPLEAVVEQLSQQVNSLNAQLTAQVSSLNAEITALKTKTAKLHKTVAFHAWDTDNPVRTVGYSTIILNHAGTNIGNAYDPLTGVFTTPVSGLYDFRVSIMTYSPGNKQYTEATMHVDDTVVAIVLSDSRVHGQYSPSSSTAILHVNAGQRVYLKSLKSDIGEYYDTLGKPYTTFSGILIEAD